MIAGLLTIGMILIASALRGTEHELAQQLQDDMLGQNGFIVWALCVVIIGCLGYIPYFRTTSRYLLALVAVVIVLRNGGVWQNAQQALQEASGTGPAPSVAVPEPKSSSSSGGSSDGSGGSTAGTALKVIGTVAEVAAFL
jgi:hypothetical protein